jgi:hypothetical protein
MASSPYRATSCTPTGSPPSLQARGRLIAGCPVMLNIAVNGTYSENSLCSQPSGSRFESFWSSSPSFHGIFAVEGRRRTSTFSKNVPI